MRDDQNGRVLIVSGGAQQLDDVLAVLPVEGGGRLIGEDEARLLDERSANRDTLLFTAGQLQRPQLCLFRQAEHVEHLSCFLAGFPERRAGAPAEDHFQLFAGGQGREEIVALEDETEVLEAEVFALAFGQ
jgi:hypothetical protein